MRGRQLTQGNPRGQAGERLQWRLEAASIAVILHAGSRPLASPADIPSAILAEILSVILSKIAL